MVRWADENQARLLHATGTDTRPVCLPLQHVIDIAPSTTVTTEYHRLGSFHFGPSKRLHNNSPLSQYHIPPQDRSCHSSEKYIHVVRVHPVPDGSWYFYVYPRTSFALNLAGTSYISFKSLPFREVMRDMLISSVACRALSKITRESR